MKNPLAQDGVPGLREYTLVAREVEHELQPGIWVKAWTFGGTVPGTPIRVTQGERLRVVLQNQLPEPVTIHWHGMRVPNEMDGVPGVTQNAVQPGERFVYEFVALDAGTYWYHSHQKGAEQVDKGLYGPVIVDPCAPELNRFDRDYTLILDEWIVDAHGAHGTSRDAASTSAHDSLPTINGRSGSWIAPLEVTEGERIRLRLVNAGHQTYLMHLHGHSFCVTHSDGQPIHGAQPLKDTLVAIGPGERYDLAFTADKPGIWHLEGHGTQHRSSGMVVEIRYSGHPRTGSDPTPDGPSLPVLGITAYGSGGPGAPTMPFDLDYHLELGARMAPEEGMGMEFTLNGKSFPDTEPIMVRRNDHVRIRLVSTSGFDHPMHIHGHFFRVLTRNGRAVTGGPLMKDTLNVRPGEWYEIAVVADAPGDWMFHCHDLHHAAAGMATLVRYEGFVPGFTPSPKAVNRPT